MTSPPPNPCEPAHVAYSQYDYSTGLLTGFKDRNGIITQSFYNDPFDRPSQIIAALGVTTPVLVENHTRMYYAGAPVQPPPSYGVTLTNNDVLTAKDQASLDDGNLRSWTHTDGFGRTQQSFSRDPQGDAQVMTTYDGLGRVKRVTNPYRSTSDPTYGYTDTSYDLAGRVTRVESFTGAGGTTGAVMSEYNGPRVLVIDQAGKKRISQSDGLGRLLEVWEVTAADGATEALNFPNHSEIVAGYRTTYSYDGLDDLTQVRQQVGAAKGGGAVQSRTFGYDGLKRLLTASNPESGMVSYDYDANSNLWHKTDNRGIQTTFTYDALNRVKQKSYTNDPQNTPVVNYYYDGQAVPSLPAGSPSFNRGVSTGRLVATTYGGGNLGSYEGYDELGRVVQSIQVTNTGPSTAQAYGMSYGYNLASAMTSETYPSNRVVQTEYDEAGRVAGVKKAAGGYWAGGAPSDTASRIQYAAHGAVSGMKLGNSGASLWERTTFNTRLQPTQIRLGTVSNQSSVLQLDYTYGATSSSNNGNVASQTITIGAGTGTPTVMRQCYGYDALNRLQTATEYSGASCGGTPQWSQTYGYDRYGNRAVTASSGYVLNPLTPTSLTQYNASTNRLSASGYDGAGNQTQEGGNRTFTYDAENRQLTFNGTVGQYVYDGDGRRVKKIDSTSTTVFVYDAGGRMIAEYTSGNPTGSGTSYVTSDGLGSTRVVTRGSDGSVKARYDYLPFGEELGAGIGPRTGGMGYSPNSNQDNTRQKFTSKVRDTESGLDFFEARYFSAAQGRFTSPDEFVSGPEPVDDSDDFITSIDDGSGDPIFYADPENPQSLNKYHYCYNNPLSYVDPTGHQTQTRGPVRVEYEQATGRTTVRDQNGRVLRQESGYSGHGVGVNNPSMEATPNVGPIPQGTYIIGPAQNNPHTGPVSMPLAPTSGTNTHGRSGFLIHGDNGRGNQSASQGCVILSRATRELIRQNGGGTLIVVSGQGTNSQPNQNPNGNQPSPQTNSNQRQIRNLHQPIHRHNNHRRRGNPRPRHRNRNQNSH